MTEWPNDTPSGAVVPVITPNANNWLLTRQAVLLADDDGGSVINNPNWFMGTDEYGPNSAGSLFYQDDSSTSDPIFRCDPWVANSRVDVAATDANSLRDQVCFTWAELGNSNQLPNVPSPLVRKDEVLEAMYLGYPRGAASAPSMDRMDVMLSNAVLSPNVSEFRVEWTWADGVGRDLDAKFGAWNAPNGGVYQEFSGGLPGVVVDGSYLRNGATRAGSTPWFGLADATLGVAPASAFSPGSGNGSWSYFGSPDDYNSVRIGPPVGSEFGSFVATNLEDSRGSTPLSNIEFCDFCDQAPASGIRRYGAVFGYNGSEGIARQANGEPLPYNGGPVFGSGVFQSSPGGNYQVANTYTPWPTAVRITMRLHDPRNKITGGRLFQFVIPIPSPE